MSWSCEDVSGLLRRSNQTTEPAVVAVFVAIVSDGTS